MKKNTLKTLEVENILLKKVLTEGIGWLALKRIITQIISTVSNLVLARLLFPADFGSFAIIQFLISIFWLFADIGLAKALVQREKEPDPILLRSVWWTQLLLGVLIGFIVWILAPIVVSYYSGQVLPYALEGSRWLIIGQILFNLSSVSGSLLERHLRYSRIVVIEIIALFVTQLISICLAFLGWGIEALVFGFIVGRLISLVLYSFLSPWAWGFSFNFKKLKSLLNFGFSYQISVLLGILGGAVLPLFLGRFPGPGDYSGSSAVGFVTWAGGVAALTMVLGSIIEPIIFPIMARLQAKKQTAENLFIRVLNTISITSFPVGVLLIVLAPSITKIIYTPLWLPGVPSLRLAVIQVIITGLTNLSLLTLLSFGEAKFVRNIHLWQAIFQWILTIPLVLILGFWGYNLAGILVSAISIYSYLALKKHLKVNFLSIIRIPLLCSVPTGLFTFGVATYINISNIFELVLASGSGFVFYLGLIFLFSRKAVVDDIKALKEVIVSFNFH